MKKQNKNIVNKLRLLNEELPSPEDVRTNFKKTTDTMSDVVKSELGTDDEETKEIVGGILKSGVSENDGFDNVDVEVGADKYDEYRQLMQQLADEESGEQPVKEAEGVEPTNNPVKLKQDVEKLMGKLDISSIAPYLAKIDNPVEQAEVIGQFAEKIGVPKAKLSSVVAQLKTIAENKKPKMTKNKLVEAVTGRKVIKTIKVKDIK